LHVRSSVGEERVNFVNHLAHVTCRGEVTFGAITTALVGVRRGTS
jgi:hypothetical protein